MGKLGKEGHKKEFFRDLLPNYKGKKRDIEVGNLEGDNLRL